MAIKQVVRMGDERLKRPCLAVEAFDTSQLHELVQDMKDTMKAEDGAGLAANQIGVNLRVILFGFDNNPRYPEQAAIAQTVLINPIISILDDRLEPGWEGCLSIPGMRGLVPRYRKIRYQGVDEFGQAIDREAEGFHARVVQHEFDHLEGILYPQRMNDLSLFGFVEELSASGIMNNASLPCESECRSKT